MVFCSKTIIPDSEEHPLHLSGGLSHAPVRWIGVYAEWRERQRIEQYQDNLLMLRHSSYLETCRRAFVYCLKKHNVSYTAGAVQEFMKVYKGLQPYGDTSGVRARGDHDGRGARFRYPGRPGLRLQSGLRQPYKLPTEDSEYQPDIIVDDFVELAARLLT